MERKEKARSGYNVSMYLINSYCRIATATRTPRITKLIFPRVWKRGNSKSATSLYKLCGGQSEHHMFPICIYQIHPECLAFFSSSKFEVISHTCFPQSNFSEPPPPFVRSCFSVNMTTKCFTAVRREKQRKKTSQSEGEFLLVICHWWRDGYRGSWAGQGLYWVRSSCGAKNKQKLVHVTRKSYLSDAQVENLF